MNTYKNLKRVDSADKLAKHKLELQQCEYYMNIIALQPLNHTQAFEAEKFANNMYEILKKEAPSIAEENTSPTPRNIDHIENLKMNLQAIHKMLTEIMVKEAKDIIS